MFFDLKFYRTVVIANILITAPWESMWLFPVLFCLCFSEFCRSGVFFIF